eukprot:CAMPEP_0173083766 /NCGR_PEP_ID=MMETSP1102-20130122/19808_1 /TAXON_ID=49646 /ORGANISM="Geminigera sp., Strain Caron Lab Isolate" /LENGTH=72 /DNA_ID=CAMNT_0013961089 /DNA_START=352 /DNA_END=567 /DNA_ORIENTATION=-
MTKVFKESDELPLYARLAAVQAVPAGAMFFSSYSPLVEGTCASDSVSASHHHRVSKSAHYCLKRALFARKRA